MGGNLNVLCIGRDGEREDYALRIKAEHCSVCVCVWVRKIIAL